MTATVEQIESWIVDVPTIRPHKLSMTTMGCQSLVIVRLTRSDGICGIGEATTIGGLSYGVESPEAISSAITHYLTPLLKGQPADNLNALTARMNGAIKGNTFAKSAIETALLDAQGKALGLPVSALLGGALPEEQLEVTLSRATLIRYTPHTLCDLSGLRAEIARVRMQGYALADRQIEVGLCSLAVPVLSRHGQVVAALNVGVPAATVSAAALKGKALAPLRRAAMDLSLQL